MSDGLLAETAKAWGLIRRRVREAVDWIEANVEDKAYRGVVLAKLLRRMKSEQRQKPEQMRLL
jgi:hypothetical protein